MEFNLIFGRMIIFFKVKVSWTVSVIAVVNVMTKSVKMDNDFFSGKHFTSIFFQVTL